MADVAIVKMREREYSNLVEALEYLDDIPFNDVGRTIPEVLEDKDSTAHYRDVIAAAITDQFPGQEAHLVFATWNKEDRRRFKTKFE